MKLVSYLHDGHDQLAFLVDNYLYNTDSLHPELPSSMNMFLQYWEENYPAAMACMEALKDGLIGRGKGISAEGVEMLAPVPFPPSLRDAYAFRQHVATARRNRNLPMLAEFDQFPVFYFSNPHSVQGPGEIVCMPDHLEQLDFELEVAIVICRQGRNIPAEEADDYIGGLMILNDMSARKLQLEEMKFNLGPAKGKDFSTVLGPVLVTPEELIAAEVPPPPGHTGICWNLGMKCHVNGLLVSEGNLREMEWTFAEIIERASYGATLYPGDIIGSGTVGTGCFLELNGTGKLNDPDYPEQWLQPGDVLTLEVEGLGILENTIVKEASAYSILSKKKTKQQ